MTVGRLTVYTVLAKSNSTDWVQRVRFRADRTRAARLYFLVRLPDDPLPFYVCPIHLGMASQVKEWICNVEMMMMDYDPIG